jgi:transcriptional regulator with XRE-family HTH domain
LFRDELPRLLEAKTMSARQLAAAVGVDQSYLVAVLAGRRSPSRRLLEGTAAALGLPAEYFREYREAVVLEQIKIDPDLLDRCFNLIRRLR